MRPLKDTWEMNSQLYSLAAFVYNNIWPQNAVDR